MPAAQLAPWLSVADAARAVAFYEKAFGAEVLDRVDDGQGGVVLAELAIDGAGFWVQSDPASCPEALGGRSVRMILVVDDPDPRFARALAAGAVEIAGIHEAHGWRVGRLADPCGHHWEIAKRLT